MNKRIIVTPLGILVGVGLGSIAQRYLPGWQVASQSRGGPSQSRGGSWNGAVSHIRPMTLADQARIDRVVALESTSENALNTGEYATAEAAARRSIAIEPFNSGSSEELLARALDAQGKTQDALHAYKALSDTGDVFPRNELPYALLLLKSGQWAAAVSAYNRSLPYLAYGDLVRANSTFTPNQPEPTALAAAIHIALGLTHNGGEFSGSNQDDKALAEYRKAVALSPDSALTNYYYGYGWQHLALKNPSRTANAVSAKAALQKAASLGEGKVKKDAEEALSGFH